MQRTLFSLATLTFLLAASLPAPALPMGRKAWAGTARVANKQTVDDKKAAELFVETFSSKSLKILNDDGLTAAQKKQRFSLLFRENADVAAISDFCLGAYVDLPTTAQRNRYRSLFLNFVENVYLLRLAPYRSAQVVVGGAQYLEEGGAESRSARIVVSTSIRVPTSQEPIDVQWQVERGRAGSVSSYKIFDLVVNGISLAQEQRGAFTSLLSSKSGDFEAFLEAFAEKTKQD